MIGAELFLAFRLALRNVFARKVNLLIGLILCAGTVLLVVGGAILRTVETGMSRSIPETVTGHLQLYSSLSRDALDLTHEQGVRLEPLADFERLRRVALSVDNVQGVIPMAPIRARILLGNPVDQLLEKLREAARRQVAGQPGAAGEVAGLADLARQQVSVLAAEHEEVRALLGPEAADPAEAEALARAGSPELWASLARDPLGTLEILENEIAPLAREADVEIRLMAADLGTFAANFSRLRMVDGAMVPAGRRGFLLSKSFYEGALKLSAARKLDLICATFEGKVVEGGEFNLEHALYDLKENRNHVRNVLLNLDAASSAELVRRLRAGLGAGGSDPAELLRELFTVTGENWRSRCDLFSGQVAPLLKLYAVKVGDELTVLSLDRTGAMQSVRARLYGTFEYQGQEESFIVPNLLDLASAQALLGPSAQTLAESRALLSEHPATAVSRDRAEEALFGGGQPIVQRGDDEPWDAAAVLQSLRGSGRRPPPDGPISPEELKEARIYNAAVVLKDAGRLASTRRALQAALRAEGLEVTVIGWREASGFLGQALTAATAVLSVASFTILLLAAVTLSNVILVGTLRRVREIGTLRAIGAQRGFALKLMLAEGAAVAVLAASAGIGLGAALVRSLGRSGIPGDGRLYLFFGGNRLFPALSAEVVSVAALAVLVVSVAATAYPAFLAMKVSPLTAMRTDE